MICTLFLKYALRGTGHLQDFIALKLRKEEGNVAIIKDNQYFHQRKIFIKMAKPFLIILKMVDSNQIHMEKIRFKAPMVYDHIKMSMPELNDKYYSPI